MNKLKQFFCIAILIVIYVYVCNITLLPNSVIIFEGEELNLKTVVGLKIKRANGTNMPVIQASNLGESEQSSKYETAGTFELNLNLFGTQHNITDNIPKIIPTIAFVSVIFSFILFSSIQTS
jgi:hypothetical protein